MPGYLPTPSVNEFPADGRVWRVDFLGGIERNPAIPVEPTVQVIISPLCNASLRDAEELARVATVLDDERTVVRIGVGQLPYLKVGSLWQNGKCLQYSAGEEREYEVFVDKTAGLYTANRVVDGAQLIRPLFHRLGAGADAFCVTLPHKTDPRGLIIPAMELLRFYYAVSTPLARAILMDDFFENLNSVIDPQYSAYNAASSALILRLKRAIHDIEGWIIGRMLVAQEAKQCLLNLRASMVSQSSKGKPVLYLPAAFPFSGLAQLHVRGKYIKSGEGRWRFLVFSVDHCTAPFPFEKLIVDRVFSNATIGGVSSNDPTLGWLPQHMRRKQVALSERPIMQSKREPFKGCAPTVFPISSDAFSFLRDKRIDKLNKEQARQLHNNVDTESQNVFAEMFSTGAGGYAGGNTIAAAEIQPRQRREGLPADLEIFAAVVAELNKLETEAELRELSCETSQIPTSGGERWRYLDYALKTPREVVIGDVLLDNRWWCLVEFQQRTNESCNMGLLTRADGNRISDTTLARVLGDLPEVKGVWKNINLFYYKKEALEIRYIKHSSATPKLFAQAILSKCYGVKFSLL